MKVLLDECVDWRLPSVAEMASPGHGRRKEVCAVADKVVLTAVFA